MEDLTSFVIDRISQIKSGLEYVHCAIKKNDNELAELFINVLKADFELLKVLLSVKYGNADKEDNNKDALTKEVEETLDEKISLQN